MTTGFQGFVCRLNTFKAAQKHWTESENRAIILVVWPYLPGLRRGYTGGSDVRLGTWLIACLMMVAAVARAQSTPGDIWMTPATADPIYVDLPYAADVWMNTGSSQPDTIQFDLAYNTSKLSLPFSTTSGGIPPTFSNPNIVMGPNNGELQLQVNHSSSNPSIIHVVRAGGINDPAAISGTFKLFTITFTPKLIDGTFVTGTVSVLRDASLQQIGTAPHVVSHLIVSQGRSTVYVDFDTPGLQQGTITNPYLTMAQAVNGTSNGAIVNIYTGTTPTAMTLTKPLTLKALDGVVRIGDVAKKHASEPAEAVIPVGGAETSGASALSWADFLARLTAGGSGAEGESAEVDEASTVYEAVLPHPDAAVIGRDSVFAVRLRDETRAIDIETVWGEITGPDFTIDDLDILAVAANDVWVIYRGGEALQVGDTIQFAAGAAGLTPVRYSFTITSESALDGDALPQPAYAEFETGGIDLTEESNAQNLLQPSTVPALPGGIGQPYSIAPSRVFDLPQRVWLPLPEGVSPAELSLYYYHEEQGVGRWYSGGHVAGWLVPGSELQLELTGQQLYGFTVRHGGVVQLRHSSQK